MHRAGYNHEYYITHKEQRKECSRKWHLANKEHVKELDRKYRATHRARRNETARITNKLSVARKRQIILDLLGNKCSNSKCAVPGGMTDKRTLQIDHVNGGGVKEIRKCGSQSGYYKLIINKIRSGNKDYQLLCANCNWIKRSEANENMSCAKQVACPKAPKDESEVNLHT